MRSNASSERARTTISGCVVWLDDTSTPPVAMLTTERGPVRVTLRDEHVGDVRAIIGNAGRCLRVRGERDACVVQLGLVRVSVRRTEGA